MKIRWYLILLILSGMAPAQAQSDSSRLSFLKEIVCYLSSDSLQGRATGSRGEQLAADYIFSNLQKNKKCTVCRQYFQFEKDSQVYHSQNVIAFINNHSQETIVLSAHYDHIGSGGSLSKSYGKKEVHNGADDNASGVALMLDLARFLSNTKVRCNYLLIAYSGHEPGLYGSKYFSENISSKYKNIIYFINFDMTGRMDCDQTLYYDCTPSQEKEMEVFCGLQAAVNAKKSSTSRINVLDSKWLSSRNIPGLTLTTGMHEDYHKVTDDEAFINYQGMILIESFVLERLKNLGYYAPAHSAGF